MYREVKRSVGKKTGNKKGKHSLTCFFPCFGNPSWFKISLSSFILKYASLSCSRQGNDRYQSFKSNLSAWCVHEILQDSLCLIPGTKTISELSTPISHISCKEQWFWCTRKLGEAEWSTASCSRGIQCSLPITILRTWIPPRLRTELLRAVD